MTNDINQIQKSGYDDVSNLASPANPIHWFGCLGHRDCSRTLVDYCPSNFTCSWTDSYDDGLMGPRFQKFQILLERMNAIAKENLRGVRW